MYVCIVVYLQSECTEKYHVVLCPKYDREHDFDVVSRALLQAEMDMLEAFKLYRTTS